MELKKLNRFLRVFADEYYQASIVSKSESSHVADSPKRIALTLAYAAAENVNPLTVPDLDDGIKEYCREAAKLFEAV